MGGHKHGKIGVTPDGTAASYELVIYDHIPLIDPAKFGSSAESFDGANYFVTSGDALSKTTVLIKDLRAYAHSIPNSDKALQMAAAEALAGAMRLRDLLVEARGSNVFLESEWSSDHKLLVIPKNPRSKPVV